MQANVQFEARPQTIPVYVGPITKYFVVKERIGRGAFSVVYSAVETSSKRIVALKVVDFTAFTADKERARQQRILEGELEILDCIETTLGSHPNLAQVFAIVRDKESSRVGIAMEYLRGGELFDRIVKKAKYSEKDAAVLLKTILEGLQALHNIGIVHCDLKPENLIFGDDSDLSMKITDYGLSKLYGKPDRHDGALVGTAQYVAPEVLTKRDYSPACDVWSLGVVLYILLCGYPPFHGNTNAETFDVIKKGKYEFHAKYWKSISEDARKLVCNMLQVDPKLRFTVDQVLNDPWVKGASIKKDNSSEQLPIEILDNLKKFNAKRKFRAAAMAVMVGARFGLKKRLVDIVEKSAVNNFTLDQLEKLRESFKKNAVDGRIDRNGLGKCLGELGFGSALPVDSLFRLFDSGGEGSISYRAFLTHLSTLKGNNEETIKFCFDMYDENGDGCLSKSEISSVLRNLLTIGDNPDLELGNISEREEQVEQQIEDIFARLDSDGDGNINFEEFKNGIAKDAFLINFMISPIQKLE